MELYYFFCPLLSWVISGLIKLCINSFCFGYRKAFKLIGYGGFPSTHSSIISSAFFLTLMVEGVDSISTLIALSVLIIVALDAKSLRGQMGLHAKHINFLLKNNKKFIPLRERMGHSIFQIIGGMVVGLVSAMIIYNIRLI